MPKTLISGQSMSGIPASAAREVRGRKREKGRGLRKCEEGMQYKGGE